MLKILALLILSVSLKAQTVYKTPSGKKYHSGSCRMVKNVSEAITVSKAKELGLEACLICRPDVNGDNQVPNKPQGRSITVRCKGFTRAGTRCKHKTSIANGYCFQHQPG